MADRTATIECLKDAVREFVREREWEPYHSPKNLAMSIAIEAGELMELFQWLTPARSRAVLKDRKIRRKVEEELADVATYVLDFCLLFGIDLSEAVVRKLGENAKKYPVCLARGSSAKYTEYRKRSSQSASRREELQ